MKSSISGKAEGTLHGINGNVNAATGKLTDIPKIEVKGKAKQIAGSSKKPADKLMLAMRHSEAGKIGWVLLWLLGVPIPILLLLFLVRGCT